MPDTQVKELQEKNKVLHQQLKDFNASSDTLLSKTKTREQILVAKLETKDLECKCLRVQLNSSMVAFANFKEEAKRKADMQQNAIIRHSEQVQSLSNLAGQDREWLVEESARRITASVALRKTAEERVKSMQRRCSTGW